MVIVNDLVRGKDLAYMTDLQMMPGSHRILPISGRRCRRMRDLDGGFCQGRPCEQWYRVLSRRPFEYVSKMLMYWLCATYNRPAANIAATATLRAVEICSLDIS